MSKSDSTSAPKVRRAVLEDLPTLARIHKIAYSRSHFTALLPDLVLERYYGYFLNDGCEIWLSLGPPESIGLSNNIQGFAVFGTGIPERIGNFKRNFFGSIFRTSLRHPLISAKKLWTSILARMSGSPLSPSAKFLLLSIAVTTPMRGIGGCLIEIMFDVAAKQGFKKVGLYVNVDNLGAINTYFSAGFFIKECRNNQFYMEYDFA